MDKGSSITAQEIFDRVVARLRDGTGQAFEEGFCRYRTSDGRACAVGIFIPDGEVALEYGGSAFGLLAAYRREKWAKPLLDHGALLKTVQLAHDAGDHWDGSTFNAAGEADLERIAERYLLTLPAKEA